MPAAHHALAGRGFSLIELLVAVVVVVALASMVIGGVTVLRRRAALHEAGQVVRQLAQGLESYRTEDGRHRYPLHEQLYPAASLPLPHCLAMTPQDGAVAGVLALLVERGLGVRGSTALRDGVLTDPWGQPYRYQLTRPAPTAGMARLEAWNWDAVAGRPKARNAVDGVSAAPFPYIWSSGPERSVDDATRWVFDGEDR